MRSVRRKRRIGPPSCRRTDPSGLSSSTFVNDRTPNCLKGHAQRALRSAASFVLTAILGRDKPPKVLERRVPDANSANGRPDRYRLTLLNNEPDRVGHQRPPVRRLCHVPDLCGGDPAGRSARARRGRHRGACESPTPQPTRRRSAAPIALSTRIGCARGSSSDPRSVALS